MLFCPKCGTILRPREDGKKTLLTCRCGYSSTEKEDILLQESIKSEKKIEIVKDDTDMDAHPKIKVECPKCSGKEAHFWTIQTRAGDEAETKFFQCTKCKYRWREYN